MRLHELIGIVRDPIGLVNMSQLMFNKLGSLEKNMLEVKADARQLLISCSWGSWELTNFSMMRCHRF
jgi:hypothetical protein